MSDSGNSTIPSNDENISNFNYNPGAVTSLLSEITSDCYQSCGTNTKCFQNCVNKSHSLTRIMRFTIMNGGLNLPKRGQERG